MNNRKHVFVACGLFAVSFWMRLALISKGPYSIDTLNLAIKAEQLLTTYELSYSYGSGYPLTIVVGAVFVFFAKAAGIQDPVLAVNFMSVVLGAGCVPLIYFLARRLINTTTAVFAALFLAVAPIFLAVSTYGLSHTPALFFLLLAAYYLVRYQRDGGGLNLLVSAVAMGLLGAARLQNLALMAVPMAYLLWTASLRHKIRHFLTYGLTAGLTMTLFYLPYLTGGSRAAYLAQLVSYKKDSVIPHVSMGLLFKPFLNILFHLIHTFSPLGILLIVLGGWLLLKRERRDAGVFLLLWLICPLLLYSRLYTLVPRFLTIMHPPLCIFLAYFCAANYHQGRTYRWLSVTLAGVMSLGMFCLVFPVLQARHQRAYIPEYVQWIARQVPVNSLVISTDDSYFFKYYSNLKMLSRFQNQYVADHAEIADFRRRLDEALRQNVSVYVTEHGLRNYDPNSHFANLLTQEYRLERQGTQLYEYWQESCWQPARVQVPFYRIFPKSDGL